MQRVPRRLQENLEQAKQLADQGKTSRAAVPARRAYAAALEHLPLDHPARREAARTLGLLLLNLNQPDEGARLLQESGDRPALDVPLDSAAEEEISRWNTEFHLHLQRGELDGLVEQAEEVLARARASLSADSITLSLSVANLGQAYEHQGDMKRAERLYKEVLEMRRRFLGEQDQLVAAALLDVARVHLRSGRPGKAEPLYRKALSIQEAREGPEHADVAITLTQLASVCDSMGQTAEAREYLERSLRIRRDTLGADHPQVATALHGLAVMHMKAENHDEADRIFDQACLLLDRSLGPNHPRSIQFLMERGMNRLGQGQAARGLEYVAKARDRAASGLPVHHPLRQQIEGVMQAGRELQRKLGT